MRLGARIIALVSIACGGCGHAFGVSTAPGFVKVREEGAAYDYRAIAPDGVAVAVRSLKVDEKTSVGFWEHATILRMRELDGYVLVTSADIRSRDGMPGRELVFGHDEQGKPFVYRVRLFQRGSKLLLIEAGGAKDNMERWKASVDWMLASVRVD